MIRTSLNQILACVKTGLSLLGSGLKAGEVRWFLRRNPRLLARADTAFTFIDGHAG